QRSMEPVPPGKYDGIVRIVFRPQVGMMDAVHSRSHQDLVEESLEPNRQPHVAMVKKRVRLKNQFVDRVGERRDADQNDLHNSEASGKRDLDEVKSKCRRNIELGVDVVGIMEAPQERYFVVGHVPVVEGEI